MIAIRKSFAFEIDCVFGPRVFLDAFHQLFDLLCAHSNCGNAHDRTITGKNRREGFANDGLDLLVQARKEQPELILMDLQLSDMDGYEVLRRLNRRPETVDIPVIVMTDNPHETQCRR